ncbi:DUF6538 domain-containing protein [Pseudomonas caspiana]|uniref:DUF6538 domain-containing protein n=1 Tax=Pseudomonas caspiana TaxID=1451454 RepID=A0A1Y3P1P1_9PSED|nr:hypothetical protein AUC60_11670 [Pseudomonas caspiana]
MADNLELQGGTWHARLAIPKDVQKAFGGRKIFSQSLKTGSRREAMTRRLSIIDGWKTLIAKTRAGTPLPADWQDSLIGTLETADRIIRASKLATIGEVPSFPVPEVDPAIVAKYMEDNPATLSMLEEMVAKAHQTPMGLIKLMRSLERRSVERWCAAMRRRTRRRHNSRRKYARLPMILRPANLARQSALQG